MELFSGTTRLEESLVRHATENRVPLGGAFELLPLCNLDCKMCFLRLSPEELKHKGRIRTAKEWLQLAEEAKDAGLLFLLLTGGEPFLYPEFKELYTRLSEMGFHITINTNGTLINEEYADLLQKHPPRRVNITLYGSSAKVYKELCGNAAAFTNVLKAIDLLKRRNIALKLNGSLTSYNFNDLEKIQEIAHKENLPLEVDYYMFPCSRKSSLVFNKDSRLSPKQAAEGYVRINQDTLSKDNFKLLADAMSDCYCTSKDIKNINNLVDRSLPCRAGRSSFWITWEGNMSMCPFLETPSCPVFEMGFNASWTYIQNERNKILMPVECTTCGKQEFCTVCGACVYTETGTFSKKPEYMCELTTEKLRLMHEYANRN